MIWKPERGVRVRGISIRPGYGERRRAREAAKIPLFADLPGMLRTPEEYEEALERSVTEMFRRLREQDARDWLLVRRWYRNANEDDRREFERRWRYLPHKPLYAIYAMQEIMRQRACVRRPTSAELLQKIIELEDLRTTEQHGRQEQE